LEGGLEIKIAFITDGGNEMGMGHVMRSLALSAEIAQSNDVFFITSSDTSVQNLIASKGFMVNYSSDFQKTVDILSTTQAKVVIIDRVTVDEELAKRIKDSIGARIIIMDSKTEANQWADVVVNGLLTTEFNNEHLLDETTSTEYYCGPKYLILKPEFAHYSKDKVADPLNAKRVLLIFGGSDPLNLTDQTLRGLLHIQNQEYEIDVIIGPKFVFKDKVVRTIKEHDLGGRVHLFQNPENVAEIMWKNELIFTSPGLSMFEGLVVGSNVIVSPQNELQRRVYDYLFRNYNNVPEIFRFFDESFMLTQKERKVQDMEIGSGRAEVIKAIIG
jgi:UDP-2,4-diacetamido-2,4,6-trideoxy-beta-L-altropyranose hydrolase